MDDEEFHIGQIKRVESSKGCNTKKRQHYNRRFVLLHLLNEKQSEDYEVSCNSKVGDRYTSPHRVGAVRHDLAIAHAFEAKDILIGKFDNGEIDGDCQPNDALLQ